MLPGRLTNSGKGNMRAMLYSQGGDTGGEMEQVPMRPPVSIVDIGYSVAIALIVVAVGCFALWAVDFNPKKCLSLGLLCVALATLFCIVPTAALRIFTFLRRLLRRARG